MNLRRFIATTGQGIAYATETEKDIWSVHIALSEYDVCCLAVHPLNKNVVYAGTQGRGLLRSNDAGKTWESAGLDGQIVKSVAASPIEPNRIYAGMKPSMLFTSPDRGITWTEVTGFQRVRRWFWFSPAEPPFSAYIQGIALSPTNPQIIIAGIESGAVVRSEDGGKSWLGHRPGAVRDCHSLTFHTRDGNWVYEGGGTGLAFSRDSGKTWKQPKAGLDRRYGWACAADPVRPEVWYASASPLFSRSQPFAPPAHIDGKANAYIFRSIGGAPWQKLGGGLPQPLNYMAYALLTVPDTPGHLYAGLSSGEVWHSTDYGDTWQRLPFQFKGIHRSLVML